ncbi:hypothetical protein Bca52824_090807 [Brassica carinata]|uniref:TIR domain-containing protein n=1 Tax=Brassica carinata TaxID=52824 RepID=A0A8X7TFY8_BRACI|nr:hypothetical protein Bca52824_090807 [Brassica carinata]
MTNFSRSWKHDQVFISFRGKTQRNNLVSNLKKELKRSKINFFIDEDEMRGRRTRTLFERIRESGVALILLSKKYSNSYWCLDELVEIQKQMEAGYLIAFPVFYEVEADSVKSQTGCFGNTLLKTEDDVRNKVDRRSCKSILETEDRIWGWRQALLYIGGSFGLEHLKGPEGPLIKQSLMHPQKEATSLLQALNIKKSDIEDLITRPFIQTRGSASTDHLVFIDLISLNNPILGQRLIKHGQAGLSFLVLLGSVVYHEDFDFKPLLWSKKPRLFPANKSIGSSQEIQDQTYYSPVQVTNVLAMAESTDNTPNRLGEDKNSDCSLTCFSFLSDIMKRFAMMISPPPPRVFISFGEKLLEKNLVSFLKKELESKEISVYVEKERIKESKVAIVVFSDNYPESPQCLDELVEIKKLMDAGEINPFPIFYKLKDVPRLAQSVKKLKGCFRNRLLKIEQEVRKTASRDNVNSILDTEARIWGWRQAIKSISSKSGLSNEHSSDPLFLTDVVTKVKELFKFKDRPKKSGSDISTNQVTEEKPIMHKQETAAAAAAITTVKSGFALDHSSISRFEEPSRVLAIESNKPQQRFDTRLIASSQNHQYHINQVPNPSSRHVASPTTPQRSLLAFAPPDTLLGVADDTSNVATFTSTSPVEAEPATPPVTTTTTITASLNAETPLVFGSSTNLVTFSAPKSNSLTNEVEGNISGSTFEALDTDSRFEKGDTPQRTRRGRLIKLTQKVLEMQSTLARGHKNMGSGGRGGCGPPL